MKRNSQIALSAALLSLMVGGCFGEPSRYSVSGTVTMDGTPAPYVVVVFHPVSSNSMAGGRGPTDPTGKFKIGEDGKNSGFPSGDYKVTFTQAVVDGKPTLAGGGGKKSPEETLPTEKEGVPDDYRDPARTPITATVKSGTNDFTFDIKTK